MNSTDNHTREIKYYKREMAGKAKHDSKKIAQGIMDLINRMNMDNHATVVEEIRQENRLLFQILESYEEIQGRSDKDFDLKQIIWERAIPFITASPVQCQIQITLNSSFSRVNGNSVEMGRALINIASNALDAINESGRKGVICFDLQEESDFLYLTVKDNGTGIDKKRLKTGPDGLPRIVGTTSKGSGQGSGIGTKQIYKTFGAENIHIESEFGKYTAWKIKVLKKTSNIKSKQFIELERRYFNLIKNIDVSENFLLNEREFIEFITKLRKMEFLLYDLVMQFSRYNNVRDLFRCVLRCIYINQPIENLKLELKECQTDNIELKKWIVEIVKQIKENLQLISMKKPYSDSFQGILFSSYNQTQDRTIVFLIDPTSGNFLSADRILVEHLDLIPFMKEEKDQLLRGDFIGNLDNTEDPITLGLWYLSSRADLVKKIRSIQSCARRLISMGINSNKTVAFYDTVNNQCCYELNTGCKRTLQSLADATDRELEALICEKDDDELQGMICID